MNSSSKNSSSSSSFSKNITCIICYYMQFSENNSKVVNRITFKDSLLVLIRPKRSNSAVICNPYLA